MKHVIPEVALLIILLSPSVHSQGWASGGEVYFPILVNGVVDSESHLQTVFRFIETSGTTASPAVSVVMEMFDNNGGATFSEQAFCPPPIPATDPTIRFELAGLGSLHFGTKGFIQPYEPEVGVIDGWARIRWTGPGQVAAAAELLAVGELPTGCPPVICRRPASAYLSDALVQPASLALVFHSAAVISRYRRTAFSIVNPTPSLTAHVSIELFDGTGTLVRHGGLVTIPPMHRLSRFAWEFATVPSDPDAEEGEAPPPPEDFYGSARIVSDSPIVVGGLQVLLPEGRLVSLSVAPPSQLTGEIRPNSPEVP